jgi:hypothetical protein
MSQSFVRRVAMTGLAAWAFLGVGCAWMGGGGALSTNPDRMARQAIEAMGGKRAFDKTRFLYWEFADHSHSWDRQTGDYRVEYRQSINLIVVLMNLKTRKGKAFLNGLEMPVSSQPEWIEAARGWFLDDSFWLLNVMLTLQKGVHREYVGIQEVGGKAYPTLHAWSDDPQGPIPKGHYWYYIDPQSHLPVAWSFHFDGDPSEKQTYWWAEMGKAGELSLPIAYRQVNGERRLEIRDLFSPTMIDQRVFHRL